MRRGHHIFGFIALCLLVAAPALADTLEPGKALDLLDGGAVSPCETGTTVVPVDTTGVSADASCDETTSMMTAKALLEGLAGTEASAEAFATLLYGFDISFSSETKDNPVQAQLSYDVSWVGGKRTPVEGQAMVGIVLKVWDVSDSANPMAVAEEGIHTDGIGRGLCTEPDCVNIAIPDIGDEMSMLTLTLLRGHSYQVTVALSADANVLATVEAADTFSDYMSPPGDDDGGAMIHTLTVAAGLDIAELAAQVEQNTEDIAALNIKVDELRTDLDALASLVGEIAGELQDIIDRLDELEGDFEGHTHTYLTGRGTGHNNTEAETGPEIDGDDDVSVQPTAEPLRKNGRAKPRKK